MTGGGSENAVLSDIRTFSFTEEPTLLSSSRIDPARSLTRQGVRMGQILAKAWSRQAVTFSNLALDHQYESEDAKREFSQPKLERSSTPAVPTGQLKKKRDKKAKEHASLARTLPAEEESSLPQQSNVPVSFLPGPGLDQASV